MMDATEARDIIDRYRSAYEKANKKPAGNVEYRKGWFVWTDAYGFKRRKAEIIAMTGTLLWRASNDYL